MTVHSAKGLEFGVVAVASLGRRPQLGWTPLRLGRSEDSPDAGEGARVGVQLGRLGRPGERLHGYAELTELAADREAEEEGRLAYVAATRAKRRLLLSGIFNPKAKEPDKPERQPIAMQILAKLLDGDPSTRDLEIPAAGDGFPAGVLQVSLNAPGPGVGASLLTPREAPAPPPQPEESAPPLGRPQTVPAPAGALSYSALSDYERCGYRFYVERVLGLTGTEAAVAPTDDEAPAGPEARRRFGPGLAVHALLEWSSEHRWMEPDAERVAAALREQGLPSGDDEVERALELVRGWLGSDLLTEVRDARTTPELPFVLALVETPIRGSIDLLAERPDGSALVIDYKTDRLEGRSPADAAKGYLVQRELYALAAAGRGNPVETAYVFLERPGEPVRHTFDEPALEEARAHIESLLGRLGKGNFEVTHHPHRALCYDCPARERLCSHETAAQMRDESEPPIVPIPRSERPRPDPDQAAADGEPQMSLLE
jgi:ATP-dependent exoDNAse (exonuclease V) beta subunit